MRVIRTLWAPALAALALGGYIFRTSAQMVNVAKPAPPAEKAQGQPSKTHSPDRVVKSEAEWKRILTPAQFEVMRKQGTEAPFSSELLNEHRAGVFRCAACGKELFSSKTKFESGTGWPSFWAPLRPDSVKVRVDNSDGMQRDEVICSRCDAHLGHVFDDGPAPTHLRYCMNGVALKFVKAGK